jgi:sRNA-binding protein
MTTQKSPDELLALLKGLYPNSIGADLPLKIGVHIDLREQVAAMSAADISAALNVHVNSDAYLRAIAKSYAQRVDLDGNPVAAVSDEQRHVAASILNDRASLRNEAAADKMLKAARTNERTVRLISGQLCRIEDALRTGVIPRAVFADGADDEMGEFDE